MDGDPNQVKSCIVDLGNLERCIWSREDKYALDCSPTTSRLLISMAVDDSQHLKQGDGQLAFCNGIILHDDEIYVVKPPATC